MRQLAGWRVRRRRGTCGRPTGGTVETMVTKEPLEPMRRAVATVAVGGVGAGVSWSGTAKKVIDVVPVRSESGDPSLVWGVLRLCDSKVGEAAAHPTTSKHDGWSAIGMARAEYMSMAYSSAIGIHVGALITSDLTLTDVIVECHHNYQINEIIGLYQRKADGDAHCRLQTDKECWGNYCDADARSRRTVLIVTPLRWFSSLSNAIAAANYRGPRWEPVRRHLGKAAA